MHTEVARNVGRDAAFAAARSATRVKPACFSLSDTRELWVTTLNVRIAARHAEALAELLPLVLCGEESAALAFGHYAGSTALHAAARKELDHIRSDEERHARWLQRLKLGLPAPRQDAWLAQQLRRFYSGMCEPEPGRHLARIAALDSAVCTLLGVLRRRHGPIAADAALSCLFAHIHRDEARHAAVASRHAGRIANGTDLRGIAFQTRASLTQLLAKRADALEQLGLCPDTMMRRLGSVPRRLFG